MNLIKPHIKMIKTIEGFYLFDINTNNILEINETIYEYFTNLLSNNEKEINLNNDNYEIVKRMYNDGLLKEAMKIEIQHSMTEYLEAILEHELAHLCLQITQNCNLRCEYCVFSGSYKNRVHSNKRMNWEIAKRALDFLYEHSGQSDDEILIGFYGGEPLLEFEVIKKCVDYSRMIFKNKKVQFNMTTNATLLNDEIIQYLFDNEFALTISLDGPKEIQDSHRVHRDGSGSFEHIITNIEKILDNINYIPTEKVIFNSVLSKDVDLEKIIKFFKEDNRVNNFTHQMSIVNDVNLVSEATPENANNRAVREYEVFKMFLYGLGRIPIELTSELAFSYVNLLAENFYNRPIGERLINKSHPGGPCIPGQHKLFCDVDGNLYPCERVSETSNIMRIGNIWDGFDVFAAKRIINVGKVTEDACRNCWAYDFCTQCVAFADGGDEISKDMRLKECLRVKRDAEEMMKDFIVLQKRGCEFEKFLNIRI